jgi:hypothetical protein
LSRRASTNRCKVTFALLIVSGTARLRPLKVSRKTDDTNMIPGDINRCKAAIRSVTLLYLLVIFLNLMRINHDQAVGLGKENQK